MQSKQRTCLQKRSFVCGIHNLLKMVVCASRNQVVAKDDEQVQASLLHSPKKSTGITAKDLSISKTALWRVLGKRLVFKPYCIQMVQQLSDEDHSHPKSPDITPCDFFFSGICQRPGIRPTIAT